MSEDVVVQALGLILDRENYPLMVMCNLGRHRTGPPARAVSAPPGSGRPGAAGTVVGCLRKLQRWNLTSIFEEYRRYAGSKVRLLNEQFIELFDTDLVRVPVNRPSWLFSERGEDERKP